MTSQTVLVVGASGSIGRLVVAEAVAQGYATRALVRDPSRARQLPAETQVVVGDVTLPDTLPGTPDLDPLFAALEPDPPHTVDGAHDAADMPFTEERNA